MTDKKTAIFLTDEDSSRFVLFLKHYSVLIPILDVIESKKGGGSITIHFDQDGLPRLVDKLEKIPLRNF